jgi:hypothetical protein
MSMLKTLGLTTKDLFVIIVLMMWQTISIVLFPIYKYYTIVFSVIMWIGYYYVTYSLKVKEKFTYAYLTKPVYIKEKGLKTQKEKA